MRPGAPWRDCARGAERHHRDPGGSTARTRARIFGRRNGARTTAHPPPAAAPHRRRVAADDGGALLLLSAILDDVHVKDFGAALGSAALIGLLNALVWPLVIRFAMPLTVLTLGLGVVVLNGALVLLAAAIDPGFTVDSLFAGVVVALSVTI